MDAPRVPRRTVAIGVLVATVILVVPALLIGSTVLWTQRSIQADEAAGEIALEALAAYGASVAAGEGLDAAEHAAREAADASPAGDGLEVELVLRTTEGDHVFLDVDVRRDGLGAGIAAAISRSEVRTGHATASLVNCYEAPSLLSA